MKRVVLSPSLVLALSNAPHSVAEIVDAIEGIASTAIEVDFEHLPGRMTRRVYASGHRIIYRETTEEITVLCVRPTVRRRWEKLLE